MIPATKADALRIESAAMEMASLVVVGALAGVYCAAVAGRNGPGAARLTSVGDGSRLSWSAPGSSTPGQPVDVSAGGDFLLLDGEDRNTFARVHVEAAHLRAAGAAEVFLADTYTNALASDDVTAAEAAAGDVETYSVDVRNDGGLVASRVRAWLDSAVADLEISDDNATWVSPTTEATALALADILAGATVPLYFRRTIGVSSPSDPDVLNHFYLAFDGL